MKIDTTGNIFLREPHFGIGMEKLDRDAFDPEKIYDKVACLGVKWVRIQSGWAKTETKERQYDFSWLDRIVDNLVQRDLTPWICLCYGNPLYDERAQKIVGGVGCPPIHSKESMDAWLAYCKETAKRYAGKAEFFEVWNEPDGLWNGTTDPTAYTEFCKQTAAAVRQGNNKAKVLIGSVASVCPEYLCKCADEGILNIADGITYHAYSYDERTFTQLNAFYKQLAQEKLIIHGECGSQSRSGGNGAYKGIRCDASMQAKQLLRQLTVDYADGIFFSSYFTATDMHENLLAEAGKPIKKRGYFGVLEASFDKSGMATGAFTQKPSYYAYQYLCAFLNGAKKDDMVYWIEQTRESKFTQSPLYNFKKIFSKKIGSVWHDDRVSLLTRYCFTKNGANAFVYWMPTDLLRRKYISFKMDIRFVDNREPKLVDLISGDILSLPYEKVGESIVIKSLPVRDYPMAVIFGNFVRAC